MATLKTEKIINSLFKDHGKVTRILFIISAFFLYFVIERFCKNNVKVPGSIALVGICLGREHRFRLTDKSWCTVSYLHIRSGPNQQNMTPLTDQAP